MVEAGTEGKWCASWEWGPGEALERFKQEEKGHTLVGPDCQPAKSELQSVALVFISRR